MCACVSVCLSVTQHLTSLMFIRLTNDTTYLVGKVRNFERLTLTGSARSVYLEGTRSYNRGRLHRKYTWTRSIQLRRYAHLRLHTQLTSNCPLAPRTALRIIYTAEGQGRNGARVCMRERLRCIVLP